MQTACGPRRDLAVGALADGLVLVKSGWPTTTSAGWLLTLGMVFQMRTRLWSVSATTTRIPSDRAPVGRRRALLLAARLSVVVVKSGWPSTTVALPRQTGHLRSLANSAVGLGNMDEAPLYSRTRWLDGAAPTRFASATNRVSAANAIPLTPPTIVSLEFESWLVNALCPITSLA